MARDKETGKKIKTTPRNPESYRAFRRNEAKRMKTRMIRLGEDVKEGWTPAPELNRSQNHPPAREYGYAREISPNPERPVR